MYAWGVSGLCVCVNYGISIFSRHVMSSYHPYSMWDGDSALMAQFSREYDR